MLSEEKRKKHPCSTCCRDHCINRGKFKVANFERTCYVKTKCAGCIASSYCKNPEKDKVPFDFTKKEDVYSLKDCFVEPKTCDECFIRNHCKNRELSGAKFEMDLSESSKPLCFSGYHSTK